MEKELSNDQVFDMIPYAVDIYEKLDFDGYRKQIQEKAKSKKKAGKNIDPMDVGIDAVKYILKNSKEVKQEIFELIAIAENKTAEEIRSQSFIKTISTFKAIFTNKELVSFFK
ncbi:hypothetical protein [Gracilibacillus saliphilus]|uniref:hypothetical protein n=1 Tax=Gracilibacillus saliphilus TaxID=543890 RepID=UPI0013D2424A|nr:hypothetical protein [Gracilibacillus saliphilus]